MEHIIGRRLNKLRVSHIVILKKELPEGETEITVNIFSGEKEVAKIPFADESSAVRYCDVDFPNVDFKF